jgi:hypothetical protein
MVASERSRLDFNQIIVFCEMLLPQNQTEWQSYLRGCLKSQNNCYRTLAKPASLSFEGLTDKTLAIKRFSL